MEYTDVGNVARQIYVNVPMDSTDFSYKHSEVVLQYIVGKNLRRHGIE